MTFILGESKLSYDHFGDWIKSFDVDVYGPPFMVGEPAGTGQAQTGSAATGEVPPRFVDVTIRTE